MMWLVEKSHMVEAPVYLEARNIPELRRRVQALADTYHPRPDRPALGRLFYTVHKDCRGEVDVVRFSFKDRMGKSKRFMRLRIEQGALTRNHPRRIMPTSMQSRNDVGE